MRGLEEQVVVVTGGGGGIGRKICIRFAEEGARVAVLDINADAAKETVEAIGKEGGARAFTVDITDPQSVAQTIADVVAAYGAIDTLVNNAGWDRGAPFLETDPDLWAKIIAINYQGPLNMHREVLPRMAERGVGKIINIASDAGRVGSSGEAVYAGCSPDHLLFPPGFVPAYFRAVDAHFHRCGLPGFNIKPYGHFRGSHKNAHPDPSLFSFIRFRGGFGSYPGDLFPAL